MIKHGMTYTYEYRVWTCMHHRCKGREKYICKGVSVCDRWRSFENFISDMGLAPSSRHSIDRIDNDGDYTPENCRWADPCIQSYNQGISSKNTSGVKGVSFHRTRKVWIAQGKFRGKAKSLYFGPDFFEACCARKSWENNVNLLIEGEAQRLIDEAGE